MQERFEVDGHITVPQFAARRGAAHFFGTRAQRLDPVVGQATAWSPDGSDGRGVLPVVAVRQVHGTEALVVDRPIRIGERFDGGWDALVTNQPGVLLAVRTADCVPVLVHDPVRGAVAAIHAGWRGAVAGILPRTLALMTERYRTDPKRVMVAIGPSVGACCYEVDEPVLAKVREHRWWPAVVREIGPGKAMLDLRALLARQAVDAGVGDNAIARVQVCTVCHPTLFYSYRRQGKVDNTMVSGIVLTRAWSARRPARRTKRRAA